LFLLLFVIVVAVVDERMGSVEGVLKAPTCCEEVWYRTSDTA